MESNETRWKRFISEVTENGFFWTIEKNGEYCISPNRNGTACFPWWSSRDRVLSQLKNVSAYRGYTQIGFTAEQFLQEWVPSLKSAKCLLGINYAGKKNIGFDLPIDEVVNAIRAAEQDVQPDTFGAG
jgi:hypothetical protein